MTPTLLAFALAADEAVDKVRPGWVPFLIVLALGAFVVFLYFSLRKQLGKIDIPEGGVPTKPGPERENGTPPSEQSPSA